MKMAATKRARVARGMVTTTRVAGDKESEGGTGHCVGNEDGVR